MLLHIGICNEARYREQLCQMQNIISRIQIAMQEFLTAKIIVCATSTSGGDSGTSDTLNNLFPPTNNYVKINIDGAFEAGLGRGCVSGIARNVERSFIRGFGRRITC